LTVEVRGQEIILSKEPAWKKLRGAAGGGHSLDPPNPPTVAEVDAFNRMIRELRNQGPSFAAAEK
jgi:predicted metal-binding protein